MITIAVLLQKSDSWIALMTCDHELLFQQRIGVARMTVHVGRRFEEADRRQVARIQRVEEVVDVVLVVRGVSGRI